MSLVPEDMGRLALREQLVLTSLGASKGNGLEEVFFALTGQLEAPPAAAEAENQPAPAPIR